MTSGNPYTLRCNQCHTKNRIPAHKLNAAAKCGKCGTLLDASVFGQTSPIMVNDGDFEKRVLQSPLPVLVYFMSPTCPGCQTMTPLIHDFCTKAQGRIRVAKVNIEQSQRTAARYQIMSVPSLVVIDGGQTRENVPGNLPPQELLVRLAKYI